MHYLRATIPSPDLTEIIPLHDHLWQPQQQIQHTCTRHRTTPEQPKGGTTGEQPAVASSRDRFLRETIHEEPNIINNQIFYYTKTHIFAN